MNSNEEWLEPSLKNVLPLFPFPGYGAEFILEMELSVTRPPVDFSMCFRRAEVGQLLTHWQNPSISPQFKENILWQRIFQFCTLWQQDGTPLNTQIADMWFEFDHPQLEKRVPEPCVFFSPRGLFRFPGRLSETFNTSWLVDTALVILAGKECSAGIKQHIAQCVAALPVKGAVFQVGILLARHSLEPIIRLCTSMPLHLYAQFLVNIGWPGSTTALELNLQAIEPYVDTIFVDIDVGDSIGVAIGLECCYRNGTHTETRIKSFLSFLTREHLATTANANFVQEWIQNNHVPVIFEPDLEESQFKRSLSHIKIILNPDNSIKTKAYLSLSRRTG